MFWRFSIVGTIGFFVDVSILLLLTSQGINPYLSRLMSFMVAATCTWLLNRFFTFNTPHKTSLREWRHYILIMSVGALVNNAVYILIIYLLGYGQWQYVLGVAMGSLSALSLNFLGSKRLYSHH